MDEKNVLSTNNNARFKRVPCVAFHGSSSPCGTCGGPFWSAGPPSSSSATPTAWRPSSQPPFAFSRGKSCCAVNFLLRHDLRGVSWTVGFLSSASAVPLNTAVSSNYFFIAEGLSGSTNNPGSSSTALVKLGKSIFTRGLYWIAGGLFWMETQLVILWFGDWDAFTGTFTFFTLLWHAASAGVCSARSSPGRRWWPLLWTSPRRCPVKEERIVSLTTDKTFFFFFTIFKLFFALKGLLKSGVISTGACTSACLMSLKALLALLSPFPLDILLFQCV